MIKKLAWLLMCLFLLASCGGGTDLASNGVGSGGTGSYTSGPVSGLGSIIVNGVRYDVENATVTDDDGTVGFGKSSLQLGMYVEVQGLGIEAAASSGDADASTATTVRVASDFVGPARDFVRNGGGDISSFTMFGRTVLVDSKTVFSEALASEGTVVSVYGLVSDEGQYVATRVQVLHGSPALHVFKASGRVSAWNQGNNTFMLGGRSFEYAAESDLPSGFGLGRWVRVRWNGWSTLSVPTPVLTVRGVANVAENAVAARLRGVVGALTSASHFVVNGVTVDATDSSLDLLGVGVGVRLDMRGRMVGGVFVASRLTVESDLAVDSREIELHGRASGLGSGIFVVKGVTVFDSVSTGGLIVAGECLEVRGRRFNGSFQLVATEVRRNQSDCR